MEQAVSVKEFPTWEDHGDVPPRFSIVIPVRNRALTIVETLKTCFAQTFQDFEVVVSDNKSSDGTLEALQGVPDPRLRIVATPAFYAMSDNFEFALRHTKGEYVIFIGADDGLYPWSLAYLDEMIRQFPSECYDWEPPQFIWPHEKKALLYCDIEPHLQAPRRETAQQAEARLMTPIAVRQPLLTGFNVYHGCVARVLARRVMAAQGCYFDGPSPDLAASFDNLLFTEGTVHLGAPVTIAGMSTLSTGWAFMAPKPTPGQVEIRAEFLSSNIKLATRNVPINSVSTTVGPYYGAFVAYWLKKYGQLEGFPHAKWRDIYARQLGELYSDQLSEHCTAYQLFVNFLIDHGAVGAEGLTPDDIPAPEAQLVPNVSDENPVPMWMISIANDLHIDVKVKRFASFKLFQWGGRLMAQIESVNDHITIVDHTELVALLLPAATIQLAHLDPSGRDMLRTVAKLRAAALIKQS